MCVDSDEDDTNAIEWWRVVCHPVLNYSQFLNGLLGENISMFNM